MKSDETVCFRPVQRKDRRRKWTKFHLELPKRNIYSHQTNRSGFSCMYIRQFEQLLSCNRVLEKRAQCLIDLQRGTINGEEETGLYLLLQVLGAGDQNRQLCGHPVQQAGQKIAILIPPHSWKVIVLGQFKQNTTGKTETKRRTHLAPPGSVAAKPALPASFLMRHFTMLMRKFPGGTEAPGWGLGMCSNLYTGRWRKAHGKVSKGRQDLKSQTSTFAVSLYLHHPLFLPLEKEPN